MRTAALAFAVAVTLLAAAPHAEAGRGAAAYKLLADDTSSIIVLDVAKAKKSAVFTKAIELLGRKEPQLAALRIDKHVDTIVFGGDRGDDHIVIVVEGKVVTLLDELKAKNATAATHAGVTYYSNGDIEAAIIDKRLVFATPGDMPAVIARSKNKQRKTPARVTSLLVGTSASAPVIGGAEGPSNLRKEVAKQLGAEPTRATFAATPAGGLAADFSLVFADETAAEAARTALATKLTEDIKGQLEAAVGKRFSDSIAITRAGTIVRIAGGMTADEVDRVLGLARLLM